MLSLFSVSFLKNAIMSILFSMFLKYMLFAKSLSQLFFKIAILKYVELVN